MIQKVILFIVILKKPVRSQEDHIEIKPIIMPTAVIVQTDTIQ